jgi:hypothetical protein
MAASSRAQIMLPDRLHCKGNWFALSDAHKTLFQREFDQWQVRGNVARYVRVANRS